MCTCAGYRLNKGPKANSVFGKGNISKQDYLKSKKVKNEKVKRMPDIIKADGNGAMLYFTASEMREASEALWCIADSLPDDTNRRDEHTNDPEAYKKYARRLANFFNAASQEVPRAMADGQNQNN